MDNNHERTKEVLANMDREADEIKASVYESQEELKKELKKELIKIIDNHDT